MGKRRTLEIIFFLRLRITFGVQKEGTQACHSVRHTVADHVVVILSRAKTFPSEYRSLLYSPQWAKLHADGHRSPGFQQV